MNTFKARLLSIFMLVSLLAALPVSHVRAVATIYRVKPAGFTSGPCGAWAKACGLQHALSLAVAGDTLWVAAGTYKPTTGTDRTVSFTLKNGVAIYGGFAGTETALAQRNPLTNVTILSGDLSGNDTPAPPFTNRTDNSYHVVVGSGTDSTAILDGFTITGGYADVSSSDPAEYRNRGAGLLNLAGSPTLTNLRLIANRAVTYGGGMYSKDGSPALTNIIFSGNDSNVGGGLYNQTGFPTLMNMTFSANTAAIGGGMYNWTSSTPSPNTTLTNVTFSGNTAQNHGGGIFNEGSPTLTNVTFYDNEATLYNGGGMVSWAGTPALRNVILWGNTAPAGSGPQIYTNAGHPSISDSLVQGGCPGLSACSGTLIISDPRLSALGYYGGFTPTHRFLPGSPAIDQGNNGICPSTDQRGVLRPLDGDGNGSAICDMGAYEYGHELFFVDDGATGANNGTSWYDAYTNLQNALDLAINGDTIWVAAGTYTPGIMREDFFLLQNGVAIYGGFAGTETMLEQRNPATNFTNLSGDLGTLGDHSDNSYHIVVVASDAGSTTVLDGFWIINGNANGTIGGKDKGAGLFNTSGSPTLANLFFAGNRASGQGGGLYNDFGSPALTDVLFGENTANSGGGMHNAAGSPVLTTVTFIGNMAVNGGGMSSGPNALATPALTDVTFTENSATNGGGIYNNSINTAFTNVTFTGNHTTWSGGGLYNAGQSPILTNVTFSNNYVGASQKGGGMYNASGSPNLTNVTFNQNFGGASCASRSGYGGGLYSNAGSATLTNVTFNGNCAYEGGGMTINFGAPELTNVTFSNNTAQYRGGGLSNGDSPTLVNVTFRSNVVMAGDGAGMYNAAGTATLRSVTFYDNEAVGKGGGLSNIANVTLVNAILWANTGAAGPGPQLYHEAGSSSVSYSVVQGGCPTGATCSNVISTDPRLGTFANHGGLTSTINLLGGSSAIDTGNNTPGICPTTDQRGVTRPQDGDSDGTALCDMGAYEAEPAFINVKIGTSEVGSYPLVPLSSLRYSYAKDDGPVKITSTDSTPLIASERINLLDHPAVASYTEFIGMPATKLTDTYLFPWYNNVSLDSQLRVANVGTTGTVVRIKIGTQVNQTYPLLPNNGLRLSYAVDTGPVTIESSGNVPIIASERINLLNHPSVESYTEFLGLLGSNTAGTRYLFPWYNNAGLDSQLRFANVGTTATTVTVRIGTAVNQTYPLAINESKRISYPGVDAGPVEVTSSGNVPIIASERINLLNHPSVSSYSEFLGLPGTTLTYTKYLFPWYNNAGLDSQLRIANVGTAPTTVTVKIGTAVDQTFSLAINESKRISFAGVDTGPVTIESSGGVPIIASERINLLNNPAVASYSEFLGLSVGDPLGWPGNQLSDTYWFPWYNNVGLDSQLRFGVP